MILRLIRVLHDGERVKAELDEVIDLCNHMQNLRHAHAPHYCLWPSLFSMQARHRNVSHEVGHRVHTREEGTIFSKGDRRPFPYHLFRLLQRAAEERGLNYLKRYFFLIAFTAYLSEQPRDNSMSMAFGVPFGACVHLTLSWGIGVR